MNRKLTLVGLFALMAGTASLSAVAEPRFDVIEQLIELGLLLLHRPKLGQKLQ